MATYKDYPASDDVDAIIKVAYKISGNSKPKTETEARKYLWHMIAQDLTRDIHSGVDFIKEITITNKATNEVILKLNRDEIMDSEIERLDKKIFNKR